MNEGIVNNLRLAADRWENSHPVIGVGELRVHEALRDAARCIEQTSALIPKWINVEERFPEYIRGQGAECYLVTDGEFIWMAYWACNEWQFAQCTDSPYVIDWTDITHWMPLPNRPLSN